MADPLVRFLLALAAALALTVAALLATVLASLALLLFPVVLVGELASTGSLRGAWASTLDAYTLRRRGDRHG